MRFARLVFRLAGIYGLLLLLPQFFLEEQIGHDYPPAITHPEYFYGFVGVVTAWQMAYLVIGQDPARHRPLMPVAVLAKCSFFVTALVLFAQQRLAAVILGFAVVELLLAALFLVAWWKMAPARSGTSA